MARPQPSLGARMRALRHEVATRDVHAWARDWMVALGIGDPAEVAS